MGAELEAPAAVDPVQAHRPGLEHPNPLAGNPGRAPEFAVRVRTADGSELEVADPGITRVALALMDMNAIQGGAAAHWGGPSAFAEVMSSIHALMYREADWRESFNFANDAGHTENGVYALKANYGYAGLAWEDLKGFRSIGSKLTGHGEGHLFPEGVMVSNGPLGSSLPIAQGLAMADHVADRDRVTVVTISDGAMMEGEAREAIAAIPGLAARGRVAPFVCVLSDNNTKLSGRIDEDAFTMQPGFEAIDDQGWKVVRVEDGHDLQAVFSAIEGAVADAKVDPSKPVFVWAKTIKGKGVAGTEENASGGHAYPLKNGGQLREFVAELAGEGGVDGLPPVFRAWLDELEAEHEAKEKAEAAAGDKSEASKIQAGFPAAMIAAADEGLPVISVSADLQGSTGIAPFKARFPQFSYEVGVAEANMVSVGAGFSKQGYIPVVDTFAQFGVTKGALPLCMGRLSQSPVIAVFSHTGFQDAADGASHQALMYLAMTGAIPDVEQYCPASCEEAEWAMGHAIRRFAEERRAGKVPATVLFFCGRENFPVSLRPEGAEYAWGKAMTLADTANDHDRAVVISANGSLVARALDAAARLAGEGIGSIVLNNATPNRPDVAAHREALQRCGDRLVTVEDHQRVGGAGAMLVAALAEAGIDCRARILGVDNEFGRSAYKADHLYDHHGIGATGIADAAKESALA